MTQIESLKHELANALAVQWKAAAEVRRWNERYNDLAGRLGAEPGLAPELREAERNKAAAGDAYRAARQITQDWQKRVAKADQYQIDQAAKGARLLKV